MNGVWKPYKFNWFCPGISHLLFADDILLLSQATIEQADIISQVLSTFEQKSGLRVILNKSQAYASSAVPRLIQHNMKIATGIHFTQRLDSYLGFPMVAGRMTKQHFNYLLDKMNTKIQNWSIRFLSKAGRATLAKSVLNAMPVYSMEDYLWDWKMHQQTDLDGW